MGFFDNKKITVYNKYTDSITGKDVWLPTLIENVDYTATQGANITKSGLSTADAIKVYINYSAFVKPYIDPKSWQLLTIEERKTHVTFTQGADFLIFGDTTAEVITDTRFFESMQKKYTDCYKITTVDRYDDIMPHFEIGGK